MTTISDSQFLRDAIIKAALDLCEYEGIETAVIPVPGTTPVVYVAVGEAMKIQSMLEMVDVKY